MGRQRNSRRWWSIGAAVAVAGMSLAACATTAAGPGWSASAEVQPCGVTSCALTSVAVGATVPPPVAVDGDPNAAGRALASATPGAPTGGASDGGAGGAAGGGAAGICANETLADSMTRAVQNGASVVLATGGFTGAVRSADGEIAVPYSEIALTDASTLAGPELATPGSFWVYGDLAAGGRAATTGETSSLWARGGRLIAVVDPAGGSGLPGPVIRVAPVVGDDVVMGWVGCWSTQGVPSRDVDAAVDIFDDRGRHPTDMPLSAVRLDDFRSALPAG
ncbi:hypothetical protein [Nakamurella sp.]|uniref:hypothetical protein n=1 Tax=Nakamurella sp. TaxID=1869182 RepID=UPI0037833D69